MAEKEELRNELIEFQNLQQQMQIILMQKQQMQLQLQEIDRAKEELGKPAAGKGAIYRFVGSVFIPKAAEALKKELSEEAEALELRKSGLQKQEGKLAERMNAIRKKVEAYQKSSGESAIVG